MVHILILHRHSYPRHVEFFDVVYLGTFIILSHALNPLFYDLMATPQALDDEITSAESHFLSVIHYFSNHDTAVLYLVTVNCWYIIKQRLAEFATAAVVFSEAIAKFQEGDMDMDVDGLKNKGTEVDVIPLSKAKVKLDHIISQSYSEVVDYYLCCMATGHKHFVWTGPPLTILPMSEGCNSILQLLTSEGEKLDHPMWPIFTKPDPTLPPPPPPPLPAASNSSLPATMTKHQGSTNYNELEAKEQRL